MAAHFFLDGPHVTADLLTPVLLRHRGTWGRDVHVQHSGEGDLVLRGHVTSYHHKQLAQEAFRPLLAQGRIRNELRIARNLVAD